MSEAPFSLIATGTVRLETTPDPGVILALNGIGRK
jgi:hypothetical protein